MKRFSSLCFLLFLGFSTLHAHSLQGTFTFEQTWKYGRKSYSGSGFTEFDNRPNGTLIATSKEADGTLVSVQRFFPSGRYTADNYDGYHGRVKWRGTWRQKGRRVVIEVTSKDDHRGRIVLSLRGGEIKMAGSHFYRDRKIGTGTGRMRPL